MPSLVTHYIFADEIKHKLNLAVDKNYYIFAQSHDILFYDSNKKVKFFGHYAHKNDTQKFIINIISYIKDKKLFSDISVLSYLYGIITHFILDSTLHPYIFYKAGVYNKNNKNTFKYNGMHRLMEKNIDAIYYQNYYKKCYKNINVSKEFINYTSFSSETAELIDYAYDFFKLKNAADIYYKDIKKMKKFYKNYVNDIGVKYCLYKVVNIFSKNRLYSLSSHIKVNNEVLNLYHNTWLNPVTGATFNYSVFDLYNIAMARCESLINKIDLYFNEKISLKKLESFIPNISYLTGTDITKSTKMVYFN